MEDYTVLPTIHAVEAIAHGVHETLQLKCGANYDSVCSKYLTDVDTNSVINRFMDELIYTDILNEAFRFYEREIQKNMKVFIMNNYLPNQQGTFDNETVRLDATSLSRIMQTFPPIVSEIVQYATTKTPEQKSSHIFLQTLC